MLAIHRKAEGHRAKTHGKEQPARATWGVGARESTVSSPALSPLIRVGKGKTRKGREGAKRKSHRPLRYRPKTCQIVPSWGGRAAGRRCCSRNGTSTAHLRKTGTPYSSSPSIVNRHIYRPSMAAAAKLGRRAVAGTAGRLPLPEARLRLGL